MRQIKKEVVLGLCSLILVGGIGVLSTQVINSENSDEPIQKEDINPNVFEEYSFSNDDRIVYVLNDAKGDVKEVIINNYLEQALDTTLGANDSNLADVEGNKLTVNGDDEQALPINLKVTYKLDGQVVEPEMLKGKSGHIVIRYDYQNTQIATNNVYVPFMVLTGTIFDNEHFKNVEVSNGKLVDDGDHTSVIGIALPGVQENLKIKKHDLDIPNFIEVEADVKDFKMNETYTLVTNELFTGIDTSKLNSVDDLVASTKDLTDAMNQLLDGSSQLNDGLKELKNKSHELVNGVSQLNDGAKQLGTGVTSLDNGAKSLKVGSQELVTGLEQLTSNNEALNGGAKMVFDQLLSMATNQIKASGADIPDLTSENYTTILDNLLASLGEENVMAQIKEGVRAKVNEQKDQVVLGVTDAIRGNVKEQVTAGFKIEIRIQVLAANNLNEETFAALPLENQNQINAAIEAKLASVEIQKGIEVKVEEMMNSDEIKTKINTLTDAKIEELINQSMASPEVQALIQEKLGQASGAAAQINGAKAQLDSYNAFYQGLVTYTNGVSTAKSGAEQLNGGLTTLTNGTSELSGACGQLIEGTKALNDASPKLVEGINQLFDGETRLSDGLKEFNEKGIQKLVDAVNGDIDGLVKNIKSTINAAKEYSGNEEGNLRFIYRIEKID